MSRRRSGRSLVFAVTVFAALGDATRLELVARLNDGGAQSIAQLSEGLGLTRQGLTQHLRIRARAGIVRSTAVGRESQFVYIPGAVKQATSYLETVSRQWDQALSRLKTLVEG